ncbi:MAG: HlyD family efflux transporter periplasmic adaptor subunit [Sedimentibacter sp.]|uniref:efflux RND transporter periplasmic adaptor subunit n=1 Tax=Sedimentibacter sp. TaxID=1960295 RepID=UPI003158AED2
MKRTLLLLFLILTFSGCSKERETVSESAAAVETMTVHEETTDDTINYMGIVNSDSLKKYSFKTGGTLKSVFVTEGQSVDEGDELLELDKSDLKLQADAAKSQADAAFAQYEKSVAGASNEDINSARLDVEKSQAAYDFALKSFNDVKLLFEEGAVSETSFKEAELNLSISEKELEQSKEVLSKAQAGTRKEDISSAFSQYQAARANYEAAAKLFEEATLVCSVKGYVAEILYREGELVPQGYPAVLVQSQNQVITVGVTQEDAEKITEGTKAVVTINKTPYQGEVAAISQTPDEQSRTFSTDILIKTDRKFYIGSMGQVDLVIGQRHGIWLEIPLILNDGTDYVYTVKNNTAVRTNIEITAVDNERALVTGLSDGDMVITVGTEKIRNGSPVQLR